MSIKKSINSFFSRLWINKSAIFKLACTVLKNQLIVFLVGCGLTSLLYSN